MRKHIRIKKKFSTKTEKKKGEGKIYQIITAEGIAKRKNSPIPWNISIEIGTRVFALVNFMYNPSKITFNQYDRPIANAAP
jgi:hypothetical protein